MHGPTNVGRGSGLDGGREERVGEPHVTFVDRDDARGLGFLKPFASRGRIVRGRGNERHCRMRQRGGQEQRRPAASTEATEPGVEQIARQHLKGRMTVWERISVLSPEPT